MINLPQFMATNYSNHLWYIELLVPTALISILHSVEEPAPGPNLNLLPAYGRSVPQIIIFARSNNIRSIT